MWPRHKATRHYLNQYWPSSITPYCVTRPQWVNAIHTRNVYTVRSWLCFVVLHCDYMMTSSNGNSFSVTGPLWEEFSGYWWIPITKAGDAELWCFLWSARTNGWLNNRCAGDFRPHRAHYDVRVIVYYYPSGWHHWRRGHHTITQCLLRNSDKKDHIHDRITSGNGKIITRN